ncbi:MAG: NAD(P)H-hydrate dehydratase [Alphaproteobacteria bacterium]|nr:NAD(P)H-hydrate dehydratase [Alphaproteobacteria bacterium]
MIEVVTSAQMRAIERGATESGEVTGLELMERAGRGVVEAVFAQWPKLAKAPHRAVVLCGPGNNGGDGYVIARLLNAQGWDVSVWALAAPGDGAPDAQAMRAQWDGEMLDWDTVPMGRKPALVIDALFGTGLARPVPASVANVFRHIRDAWGKPKAVAVDIPTGISADTGALLRPEDDPRDTLAPGWPGFMDWSFVADLTVTFQAPKLGHYLGFGPNVCGRIAVVHLPGVALCESSYGLDVSHPGHVRLIAPEISGRRHKESLHFIDLAKRPGHKFDHGHALILSGGAARTGAARLAARGALRIGAGLVTLGVPPSAHQEVACQVTSIMLRRVEGGDHLAKALQDARLNAVCLGPGLGGERARELVPVAVRAEHTPHVVLDADALTAYEGDPEALFGMLHEDCVLTPHGGEFARLFPDIAEKLNAPATKGPAYSKVDATREAAKRAGCMVLFKGPDTVIAAPDGRCSINSAEYDRAAPWLATAGSGDVLAGFITGLLARGLAPMQAAETAAWLHVECARSFGPGLIAEDLPEALPGVLRRLMP